MENIDFSYFSNRASFMGNPVHVLHILISGARTCNEPHEEDPEEGEEAGPDQAEADHPPGLNQVRENSLSNLQTGELYILAFPSLSATKSNLIGMVSYITYL